VCRKTPIKRIVLIASIFVSLLFGVLTGTDNFMQKLPVYEDLTCQICHTSSNPSTDAEELNVFGKAFKNNGHEWDKHLAELDSDGDGSTNGTEIGDYDGDGIATINKIRSNPGDPLDKPSSLDQKTWGVIKSLYK
jgi:hypothetical protein